MRPPRFPKLPKSFLTGFIVTIIFFVVVFYYFNIQFTDKLWLAVIGFGFMSGVLTSFWRRGIFHQGHFPIVTGFIFIVVGFVMFYGTFTYAELDKVTGEIVQKKQMWDLTPQEAGAFVLLIIIGILSMVSGLKTMFANSYNWGLKR